MTRYTTLIDGVSGAFGVTFPDLPGCVAMGATVDEALINAGEALRDWIETVAASGQPIPEPRSADALRADEDVREALSEGAAFGSVVAILDLGRPVKANLSLDSGVLAAIDDVARRLKITRSAAVEQLARIGLPYLS